MTIPFDILAINFRELALLDEETGEECMVKIDYMHDDILNLVIDLMEENGLFRYLSVDVERL